LKSEPSSSGSMVSFLPKLSIYAAFRGRIFFLSAGLKTEKMKIL